MKRKATVWIDCTPSCPKCGVPMALFDNELPFTIWYCDQHQADTGCEAIYLTLADVDRVLRDPAAWQRIVDEHKRYEERA